MSQNWLRLKTYTYASVIQAMEKPRMMKLVISFFNQRCVLSRTIVLSALLLSACDVSKGTITKSERAAMAGQILYVVERDDAPPMIVKQSPGADVAKALTDGVSPAYPYGLSAKGWLAMVIEDDIYLGRPDGSETKVLVRSAGKDWYPRFSPDGEWVLFESSMDAYRELYKVRVTGGAPERLTNQRAGNFDGVWSPDGRSILFSSSRYGQLDLMLMDAEGKNLSRLTQHPGDSVKPQWSADGKTIAFISGRDRRDDLFVLELEGGKAKNIRNLTKGLDMGRARVERFAFSPASQGAGQRIAFSARAPKQKSKIYVVEPGGKIRQLSGKDHADSDPVWSPDGRYIAFTSGSEIYIMRADGSGRIRLSNAQESRNTQRAWRPRWIEAQAREGSAE